MMLCYAKSLQSCPTLCDPIDGSPSGSPVPGILQARILEWVAISFSNAWKWKVKSLRCVQILVTPCTAAYQAPPSMGFSRQEYWSGVPLPSLPGGSVVKNPPANAGDTGLIPDARRSYVPWNNYTCALAPWIPHSRACVSQEKPLWWEARARRGRAALCSWGRAAPCSRNWRKACAAVKTQHSQEINKIA